MWCIDSHAVFPDVAEYHPHVGAIDYVQGQKIVEGFPDGNFQPDWTVSRSEFVKMVYLTAYPERDLRNCNLRLLPYTDVAYEDWFTHYVCFSHFEGLIKGYPDNTFRPLEKITLVEAVKILSIAFGIEGSSDQRDYEVSGVWFQEYVDYLAARGAIPRQIMAFERKVTRAQAAEMIYRLHAGVSDLNSHTYETLVRAQDRFGGFTLEGSTPSLGICPIDQFIPVPHDEANEAYQPPKLAVGCDNTFAYVSGNGIPSFPFEMTNKYDLVTQDYRWSIPRSSRLSEEVTKLFPTAPVGVAVDGLPLYSPAEEGRPNFADPVVLGRLDQCSGQTTAQGAYHYHFRPDCLWEDSVLNQTDRVIGYAFDGFPIMAPYVCGDDACDHILKVHSSYVAVSDPTNRPSWDAYEYQPGYGDLDECNGMIGPDGRYRYYATDTFPYLINCYRGEVEKSNLKHTVGPGFKYRQNHPSVHTRFLGHRREEYVPEED